MARRTVSIRHVPIGPITVPAGTAIATPTSTPYRLGPIQLVSIHLLIPRGHAGLTGIRFDLSGQTVLPWSQPPAWITADGLDKEFEVGVEVGDVFAALAYNIDTIPHTFYGFHKVADLADNTARSSVQLVPIAAS